MSVFHFPRLRYSLNKRIYWLEQQLKIQLRVTNPRIKIQEFDRTRSDKEKEELCKRGKYMLI